MSGLAVSASALDVDFGQIHALRGVDLAVPWGSTVAVLGHNGAGKTTLIRTLSSALRPSRGRVEIAGIDIAAEPMRARRRIGVTGQFSGLDDYLTGRENLQLFARLMGLRAAAVDEVVDRLGLRPFADTRVGAMSGGTRRRIDLAASLVAKPDVLFLDEPTTGLDPIARNALWDVVGELTGSGCTVVLTTQYLEEADRLADQVVMLNAGRIAASGTPTELKRLVGAKVVTATIPTDQLHLLGRRPDSSTALDRSSSAVSFSIVDPAAVAEVVGDLAAAGVSIEDLDVGSPSLDDVFAHLSSEGVAS